MRLVLIAMLVVASSILALAQESREQVMEKRAREMHRVLGLNDRAAWKKFIKDNYTQALIDKPMRAKVQISDNGSDKSSETSSADNLEAKAGMFERLHNDFGDSKITSLKVTGDDVEMIVLGDMGLKGTFHLKFEQAKPYLIGGLGIAAGN
jgi:hypothetical protein